MNSIDNQICLEHPSIFNNISLIYWQHWDMTTLVQNALYHFQSNLLPSSFILKLNLHKTKMFNGWIRTLLKTLLIFLHQCIWLFDEPMQIILKNYPISTIIHSLNLLKSNSIFFIRNHSKEIFVKICENLQ